MTGGSRGHGSGSRVGGVGGGGSGGGDHGSHGEGHHKESVVTGRGMGYGGHGVGGPAGSRGSWEGSPIGRHGVHEVRGDHVAGGSRGSRGHGASHRCTTELNDKVIQVVDKALSQPCLASQPANKLLPRSAGPICDVPRGKHV